MEKCSLCIGCIVLVVIELKGLDAAFYEKREVSVSLRFTILSAFDVYNSLSAFDAQHAPCGWRAKYPNMESKSQNRYR